ncbi:MAG: hypothetical protein BGO26_12305 [Actinobacteria bacterium 69-20]|nr:hypothetical protein [Actinomycetota bacterium]OJV26660.1 MAG: hypothetical protein BGO26_12305 [Actinobacteria bacterium 69-20]
MAIDSATRSVPADLRAWAKGIYPTEAAVQLLLQAFDGRFARPGWPWIKTTASGNHYLDAARLSDDHIGVLSGGERRVLAITRSLLGEQPVDLADALAGLDRPTSRIVLDALMHATGTGTKTTETDLATAAANGRLRKPHRDRSTGISR